MNKNSLKKYIIMWEDNYQESHTDVVFCRNMDEALEEAEENWNEVSYQCYDAFEYTKENCNDWGIEYDSE